MVQLDFMEGREPSARAIDALTAELSRHTGKLVNLEGPSPFCVNPSDNYRVWRAEDAWKAAQDCFHDAANATAATLHVIYLDGEGRVGDQRAAGIEIHGFLFIFPDVIRSYSLPAKVDIHPEPEIVERNVLLHEMGHAFGLVHGEVPMVRDHEDKENPFHSSNPESVMHVNVDSVVLDASGRFEIRRELSFDEDDLADLATYRESLWRKTS